jgi:hypothetical protein
MVMTMFPDSATPSIVIFIGGFLSYIGLFCWFLFVLTEDVVVVLTVYGRVHGPWCVSFSCAHVSV